MLEIQKARRKSAGIVEPNPQARATSVQQAKIGGMSACICAPQFYSPARLHRRSRSRGRLRSTVKFIEIKKRPPFFAASLVNNYLQILQPFYWQAWGDAPANDSQNLGWGAPPAAPVAGIVIVCSVSTPFVTTPPFGTVIEG